jgi:hypothetical protein
MSTQRETKHGQRQDDALKRAARPLERSGQEAYGQEWRQAEPLDVSDADAVGLATGGMRRGTPPGMDVADVEGRSELARWLQPSMFPAGAERLRKGAQEAGAPDHVLALLEKVPGDQEYENVQALWRASGGGVEDVSRRS